MPFLWLDTPSGAGVAVLSSTASPWLADGQASVAPDGSAATPPAPRSANQLLWKVGHVRHRRDPSFLDCSTSG